MMLSPDDHKSVLRNRLVQAEIGCDGTAAS
jgi:hypothetical protein